LIRSLGRRIRKLSRGFSGEAVEREWVSLPDGVRLATSLFRPRSADPRTPAVLIRTPFGSRHPLEPHRMLAASLAKRGLHVVLQDVRGRFDSEGRFTPFVDEAADGEAAIRWVEEQPWYDGRLVVAGFSYAGWTALAAASRAPERVAARVVVAAGSDLHRTLRPGGAFALAFGLRLGLGLSGRRPRSVELARALRHRPLVEADRVALRETSWLRDWMTHAADDEVWPRLAAQAASDAPTLFVGGLQDPFTPALLADFASAGAGSRLWLGPWPHPRPPSFGRRGRAYHRTVLRAIVEFVEGVLSESDAPGPRVRIESASGGISLDGWPPGDARPRAWYLQGEGRLGVDGANAAPDRYEYDPDDPVPSLPLLFGETDADRRSLGERPDVLHYTSESLAADLDAMGPARVVLFASSSAPDTDFVAVLADVSPEGKARGVCEGIVRCRHRDGGGEAAWLEPGEPVELAIDLGACAHRFRRGHRMRLEISSSSLPRYDRNPNTREDPASATSDSSARATQTVLHDERHPSRLELSVGGQEA
jgi:putative CocE/NonD family hydrolase